jgi:glycosyltransferase involved in cell wall biosynthesis
MKDNNSMLVSVIVISYNSSKFVIETLESIKDQTYKNIELIISDDCSTDNTIDICESWLADNSIRFINTKIIKSSINTGVSANVNRGVFNSTGEWFKLIAGDDLLLKDCIYENIERSIEIGVECSVITSHRLKFKLIDNQKIITRPKPKNIFFHDKLSASDQYQLALRSICPPPNTLFIKKNSFLSFGGCDERYPMLEDGPLTLNLLSNGYKYYWLESDTVLYRMHNDSIYHINTNMSIYREWVLNSYFPVYFQYIYPNISIIEKSVMKYLYKVAIFVKRTELNKYSKTNWLINKILTLPAEKIRLFIRYYFTKMYEFKVSFL